MTNTNSNKFKEINEFLTNPKNSNDRGKYWNELSDNEKEMIQNKMGIFPKTIIQEKIVYREKKVKSISKPKLNIHDDY